MPDYLIPALLFQILAVGYTPGPANIYSLSMSLRHGRKQSMRMWIGLLSGFSVAICILAILTHNIGTALGEYIKYLKYPGAAYIIYLAWKISSSKGIAAESDRACTFTNGFLIQFTNAKMLLFDISAFSTFVLPYSTRLEDLLGVCAWLLIAGPGANLVWLLAGSYLRRFFLDYGRIIDTTSAIALLLCAIYIIFS